MSANMAAPNPFNGVENNTLPSKDGAAMNDVVARLTGMKHLFDEGKASSRQKPVVEDEVETAQAAQKNRGPESSAYGRSEDSVKQAMPKAHKMPSKKPDEKQPGGDDIDDTEQEVGAMEPKKEHVRTNFSQMTGLKDMTEWRSLAGLPALTEAERGTGQVPTAGVNKENKMKGGGLPGLEGTPMVNLQPVAVGDDGADSEETFDQDIAQLKKEEYERLFAEYLESRGVHPELFAHLVDEAMASNDVAEMDVLIQVEANFRSKLKESLKRPARKPTNESKLRQAKFRNPKTGRVESVPGVQIRESKEVMEVDCDDDGKGQPDWRGALSKLHKKLKTKKG